MIPIDEFLSLRAPALDLKVLREWQYAPDDSYIAYVLQYHADLDYQHLRCALRILKNVDHDGVRDLLRHYATHSEPGYSSLAIGALNEQKVRGPCVEVAGEK